MLAYTTVTHGSLTSEYTARFVGTYHAYPPGMEHETVILGNGGPPSKEVGLLLLSLPCRVLARSNYGWDIGGYLELVKKLDCDLLVCCGESVYFHRAGWLQRLAEAFMRHGPGMYGVFSSYVARPHLNTTMFACCPKLLRGYGRPATNRKERYEFEHGERSFVMQLRKFGFPAMLVTWDGEWPLEQWRVPDNILWRGNQSNCLAWCIHTDRYVAARPEAKQLWAAGANRMVMTR